MWVDSLLGLVAPPLCKECRSVSSDALCKVCYKKYVDEPYEHCIICDNLTTTNNLCRTCQISSPFSRVFVIGENSETLKKLVYDYKLLSQRHIAKTLVSLLDEVLPILPKDINIVPIPTIASHIRQRGFGHTELIAKLLARRRHLPYRKFLTRNDNTVMHGLKANERKKAAKNTFKIMNIPNKDIKVLLIDDIYTTGATALAATELLKNAGVSEINLAIIARHPKK